jgi:hypothetical protein
VGRILIAVVFLFFFNLPAFSHDIPPREIVTGSYERISHVAALAPAILRFFGRIDFCPGLADRGESFNSTDVIRVGVPCKRLIEAGRAGDIWFVHYESGGYVHNEFVGVFRIVDAEFAKAWTYLDRSPIDIKELRWFVEEGNVCLVTPPREAYHETELEACN